MAPSENEILEALADPSLTDEQRYQLVLDLTSVASSESTPLPAEALQSDFPKLRYRSIQVLARIGGSEEVDLIVATHDKFGDVKSSGPYRPAVEIYLDIEFWNTEIKAVGKAPRGGVHCGRYGSRPSLPPSRWQSFSVY